MLTESRLAMAGINVQPDSFLDEADITRLVNAAASALHEAASEYDGWRFVAGQRSPATVSGAHNPFLSAWSTLDDRLDGRFRPFYENEYDLRTIRAKARNLATFTSIAVGAMEALKCYTVGGEWQHEAVVSEDVTGVPAGLLTAVQRVIDETLERNQFEGGLDEAIHNAAREDGESLVGVYHAGGGYCEIAPIDADCLREPQNGRDIDRALASVGFKYVPAYANRSQEMTSWTFGVHTVYNAAMKRINHNFPVGYHCVFDETGRNWDYLPAFPQVNSGKISGKCLIHLKVNCPPGAKRGVSDFYPIQEVLERKYILGRNLAVGASIQAAIAYIRQHAGNVSRADVVQQLSNALDSFSRSATANRSDGRTQQTFSPGTVIDVSANAQYHAGPLGELKSAVFIEVCSYLMRCIGIRWLMPEYMISGDASNANFSSTLVAESPFVRARESDQRRFTGHFRRILWAAIKIAHDAGRFGQWVQTWQQLRWLVDLRIKAPQVASRDKQQLLEELLALYDKQLISRNELLTGLNREPRTGWDDVFAEKQQTMLPGAGGAGGFGGGGQFGFGQRPLNPTQQAAIAGALESVQTTEEAKAILESFSSASD